MKNISLRQLRTLLAVKKTGKISAAARDLGLTSPALTLQIQQLEEELGCQLFHRTKAGSIPTEIGNRVIESAHKITEELEFIEEQVRLYKGVGTGNIRLGVVSTGKYFAPRIMAAFGKIFPDINVSLFAANRAEIIAKLKDHEFDVALMGRPPNDIALRTVLFGDHPLVFIASPDHPLAGRFHITKSDLAAHKFLVRERGSGTRSSFEHFLGDLPGGLQLPPTEMGSNETIKQAVMAGLGIAFISGHTIENECEAGKLVVLDVEGTPIRRQWYSVSHLSRAPSPALIALNEFLRTRGPSLLPIVNKTYPVQDQAG